MVMPATDPPATAADPTQALFRRVNTLVKPLVKAGLGSPLPLGLGAVVLETKGRKSGKTREVPLLGVRIGDRVVVSTVRGRSQWMKNIEADDQVGIWWCGKRHAATGSVRRGLLTVATIDANDAPQPRN